MKTSNRYNLKFVCPKCGNNQYSVDRFQAAGNIWIDKLTRKEFTTISCTICFYTEIYKVTLKQFAETAHMIKN